MRKLIFGILVLSILIVPVMAEDIAAPPAPDEAEIYMPSEPQTFSDGLLHIIRKAIAVTEPGLAEAGRLCASVVAVAVLCVITQQLSGATKSVSNLVATILITLLLMTPTNALIGLGRETVESLSAYGKLFVPVMTTSLAAQGAVTTSAALCAATTAFAAILNGLISNFIVPLLYIYLCLAIVNSVLEDESLKRLREFAKWITVWSLKVIMYGYTAYMTVTGVISGSVDASALKATKLAISSAVPVIGGLLSDASETILVGAGVMKNTVGIYGLFVVISLFIGPFLKIGVQYLLMKLTNAVAGIFASKQIVELLNDFTETMGMLLSMIGVQTLLLIVSTVCFMRGVA